MSKSHPSFFQVSYVFVARGNVGEETSAQVQGEHLCSWCLCRFLRINLETCAKVGASETNPRNQKVAL